MKKSTWRKRRMKSGLTISEVANYLDIDYSKYLSIERGEVKMPNKYIDKFNQLINKNKGEKKVDRLNREEIVNQWWKEISTKDDNGKFKLYEKMKEFNIDRLSELDSLLGYNCRGASSNYLNGYSKVAFDVKNKFYSFFENELNIQPPKDKESKTVVKPRKTIKDSEEFLNLKTWYDSFSLNDFMNKYNLSRRQLAVSSGVGNTTLFSLSHNPEQLPSVSTLRKLKSFVDGYEDKTEVKPVDIELIESLNCEIVGDIANEVIENLQPKEEVSESKMMKLNEKYQKEIEKIDVILEQYEITIMNLKKEKELYIRVLEDINEL